VSSTDKRLVWRVDTIQTPPFSAEARIEAGYMLRRLQKGERLALPHSSPMPEIAPRCHELRIRDRNRNWRIIYRIDHDAIVIPEVFQKTTRTTPQQVIENARQRLKDYDKILGD